MEFHAHGDRRNVGQTFRSHVDDFCRAGKNRIGQTYRKAVYREYIGSTFTALKKRTPEWEHLGLLGPVMRAEVGDTIQVFFKNNGTQSYSMHPHGVFYEKASEGSYYNDGANDPRHNGVIAPGGTHTYTWCRTTWARGCNTAMSANTCSRG